MTPIPNQLATQIYQFAMIMASAFLSSPTYNAATGSVAGPFPRELMLEEFAIKTPIRSLIIEERIVAELRKRLEQDLKLKLTTSIRGRQLWLEITGITEEIRRSAGAHWNDPKEWL